MKKSPPLLLLAAVAFGVVPAPSLGSIGVCVNPGCPTGVPPEHKAFDSGAGAKVLYKSGDRQHAASKASKVLGGETLHAQLSGQWDDVTAIIAFPWQAADGLELQLVALALPATTDGGDQYSAPGWHRELFFLDVGDSVPRLLSSYLLDAAFTPDPEDSLTQSGQLWFAPYNLYQEAEELARDPDFYSGYEFGAAQAGFRFIADSSGTVLQIAVDIHDDTGNYQYSVEPRPGDRYNPHFLGYDLSEPDLLYVLPYFDELTTFTDTLSIQRRYHVPTGQNDPALPADFDSAMSAMSVFMEGGNYFDGEGSYAYGPLESLGYTWGEAKNTSMTPAGGGGSSGAAGPGLLILLASLAVHRRRIARASTS